MIAGGLCAVGDSLTDEDAPQTWYEHVQDHLSTIPTGADSVSYPRNWAVSGATSFTWNTAGVNAQINWAGISPNLGVVPQIARNGKDCTHLVIWIGSNDYSPGGTQSGSGGTPDPDSAFSRVYNGLAPVGYASTAEYNAQIVSNIFSAVSGVQKILDTRKVALIVCSPSCHSLAPNVVLSASFPLAASRNLVCAAVDDLATLIRAECATLGVPFLDMHRLVHDIYGTTDSLKVSFNLHGTTISLQEAASSNTAGFAVDGVHPGPAISAIFAKLIIDSMNASFAAEFPTFTEQDIAETVLGFNTSPGASTTFSLLSISGYLAPHLSRVGMFARSYFPSPMFPAAYFPPFAQSASFASARRGQVVSLGSAMADIHAAGSAVGQVVV